jgi:uncharacterized protein
MDSVQRARRGLAIFFAVLVAVSVPLEIDIARNGMDPASFIPFVWGPGFASVVARLALREGFADVSFRIDRRTVGPMLLGVVYPIAVALPAYAIAWSTGLATFDPAKAHPLGFDIPGDTPGERLVASVIIAFTAGPLAMAVLALGEEIGWRGYMLTRLIDARVPRPLLVSGLVWSLWHAPLILSGRYAESPKPAFTLPVFMVTMTAMGWLAGRMRLETGSVWPAVVLHACWNAILISFFNASTHGDSAPFFIGEGGVIVAASATTVTALLLRLRRPPAKVVREGRPSSASSSELGQARL